jgi:hypothetical protein
MFVLSDVRMNRGYLPLIFLNANIIKPIRILGRYATSASSDNPDNKIINRNS